MGLSAYLIFATTAALAVLSPGPTVVLVAAQGASNGLRSALFCIAGIIVATAILFLLSATGLAALIMASQFLYQLIKWAGVAFLLYLGLMALFRKNGGITTLPGAPRSSPSMLFAKGLFIEFANPKALLFFSAVLPQFIDTSAPLIPQMTIMCITGMVLQFFIYSFYARLGDKLATGLLKSWTLDIINKTTGAAFIFAGVKMASLGLER